MDEALKQKLMLGKGFFERKQYAQAEKYLSEVVEQSPSYADVYNMLGLIYCDGGRFTRAQQAFESALRINPAYTEAALNLAVLYNDVGEYEKARKLYQEAMARRQDEPSGLDPVVRGKIGNLYAELGDAWASVGRLDEALVEYRRAVALCPEYVDIRLRLATTLRQQQKLDEALRELEAILEQRPAFVAARIQQGVVLLSAGRPDEAREAFEKALATHPGNRSAEMYLNLMRGGGKVGDTYIIERTGEDSES